MFGRFSCAAPDRAGREPFCRCLGCWAFAAAYPLPGASARSLLPAALLKDDCPSSGSASRDLGIRLVSLGECQGVEAFGLFSAFPPVLSDLFFDGVDEEASDGKVEVLGDLMGIAQSLSAGETLHAVIPAAHESHSEIARMKVFKAEMRKLPHVAGECLGGVFKYDYQGGGLLARCVATGLQAAESAAASVK